MGLILDAIGGFAQGGADILSAERQSETRMGEQRTLAAEGEQRSMRMNEHSDRLAAARAETVRQMRLADIPVEAKAKADAEGAADEGRAKKFMDARSGIVSRRINEEYGGRPSGDTSKRRKELESDREVMTEAGLQTGQMSAKEAASLTNSADIAALRADVANAKSEQAQKMAQARLDQALQIAGMRGGSSGDTERARIRSDDLSRNRTLFTELGRDLREAELRLAELPDVTRNSEKRAAIQAQIADITKERNTAKENMSEPIEKREAKPADAPKPKASGGSAPAPKTQAEFDKLPSGTIYTAPDGKQRKKP